MCRLGNRVNLEPDTMGDSLEVGSARASLVLGWARNPDEWEPAWRLGP